MGKLDEEGHIEELQELIEPTPKTEVIIRQDRPEDDKEFVRQNMREVAELGTRAVLDMMSVAAQSGHPRAYEALAALIKSVTDSNKAILENADMAETVRAKKAKNDGQGEKDGTTVNNLFVGNPRELLELLRKQKEESGE